MNEIGREESRLTSLKGTSSQKGDAADAEYRRPSPFGARRGRRRRHAVEKQRNLGRHAVGGKPHRVVNMNVALGHPPGSMPKQSLDREFRKAKLSSNACKGMSQSVRCDILERRVIAETVQRRDYGREMTLTEVGGKYIRRAFAHLRGSDEVRGCLTNDANLSIRLVSGKRT